MHNARKTCTAVRLVCSGRNSYETRRANRNQLARNTCHFRELLGVRTVQSS